jgi:hypothetical protein
MYPRTQTASSFAELKKRLSESRMQTKERETEQTSAEVAPSWINKDVIEKTSTNRRHRCPQAYLDRAEDLSIAALCGAGGCRERKKRRDRGGLEKNS